MLPKMIMVVPALIIFGKIHFLLTSENEFFHEVNVTELRDGITSLHGIHELIIFWNFAVKCEKLFLYHLTEKIPCFKK